MKPTTFTLLIGMLCVPFVSISQSDIHKIFNPEESIDSQIEIIRLRIDSNESSPDDYLNLAHLEVVTGNYESAIKSINQGLSICEEIRKS